MRREPPLDVFTEPDDTELMCRAESGSAEAFGCLVRRHQDALVSFFIRMGAHSESEDLAQETFLRLHNVRGRYRPAAKFTTFLYTIARHVWIDSIRRFRRFRRFEERVKHEADRSHDGEIGAARARLDVQVALRALPEKLRSVVVLSLYHGLRYAEIAAVLGIPVGTVKSRMFTALSRLKEMLDDGTPPP